MPSTTTDPNTLIAELAEANAAIDIRSMLGAIVNRMGGQLEVADEYVLTLQAAERGSPARAQMVTNLVKSLLQFGYVADADDSMADADSVRATLQQELQAEGNLS